MHAGAGSGGKFLQCDPDGIDPSSIKSKDTLADAFGQITTADTYTIVVENNTEETVMAKLDVTGATVYLVGDTGGNPSDARTIVFASTISDNPKFAEERHISVTGGSSLILQNITLDGNKTGGGIYVSEADSDVTLGRAQPFKTARHTQAVGCMSAPMPQRRCWTALP